MDKKMQDANQDNALMLGKSFSIQGDILGSGVVIVAGRVDGNISSEKVILAPNSLVIGNITCDELDASGEFQGLAKVRSVIIRKNALVKGEINYLTIAIEQGSEVLGKLKKSVDKKTGILGKYASKGIVGSAGGGSSAAKIISMALPEEFHEQISSPELYGKIKISLIDGGVAPYWISLASDNLSLNIGVNEMEALKTKGGRISLRLHMGESAFDFNLPQ